VHSFLHYNKDIVKLYVFLIFNKVSSLPSTYCNYSFVLHNNLHPNNSASVWSSYYRTVEYITPLCCN